MDFFQELKKLVYSKPRNRIHARGNTNSLYVDYVNNATNAYLCFFGNELHDTYYCDYGFRAADCIDCLGISNCELCYECVDCSDLYDCKFLQDCSNSAECSYGFGLLNCKNCFGCFNLRNTEFAIFNKKYSEEEYRKKLLSLNQQDPLKIFQELKKHFNDQPKAATRFFKTDGVCIGDYISNSKNCYRCFNVKNAFDSGYSEDAVIASEALVNSYDISYCGGLDNCYYCQNTLFSKNCNFLVNCAGMEDSEYCFDCYKSRNCFGCVYLEGKEYFILNRPFSRDEYLVTIKQIKDMLKGQNKYGQPWDEVLAIS